MSDTLLLCHTCGVLFLGDVADAKDHALDQHLSTFAGDLESYDAAVALVDELLDQRIGLMRQRT